MSTVRTIDKFGRKRGSDDRLALRGAPGIGFRLAKDGNYDVGGKLLRNIALPKHESDAVNMNYLRTEMQDIPAEMSVMIYRNNEKMNDLSSKIEGEMSKYGKSINEDVMKRIKEGDDKINKLVKAVNILVNLVNSRKK